MANTKLVCMQRIETHTMCFLVHVHVTTPRNRAHDFTQMQRHPSILVWTKQSKRQLKTGYVDVLTAVMETGYRVTLSSLRRSVQHAHLEMTQFLVDLKAGTWNDALGFACLYCKKDLFRHCVAKGATQCNCRTTIDGHYWMSIS